MAKAFKIIGFCVLMTTIKVGSSHKQDCQRIGNICYTDNTYPHKEIEHYWHASQSALSNAFGKPKPYTDVSVKSIPNTCQLCPTSLSKKIQPFSVIEDGNQKLYIISTDKYPRPEIEVHICKKNSECNIPDLQNDFSTRCVQRNSQLNVLAYNSSSKQFVGKAITFPSYCECILSVIPEE